MIFSPLTSDQVLEFLPLNTWTEVTVISNVSFDSDDIYIVTTEEKDKLRKEDAEKILLQSGSFKRIEKFKALKKVAVEINKKWYRGKLISFNKFQDDDTRIELIDIGSVHQTKLQNVFGLPFYFDYDPLALPIKFKNFIPKTLKLKIKPLMPESMLHDGVVLVDVQCNDLRLNNGQNGQNKDTENDIASIQKMTNSHADVVSSYLSNSLRKESFCYNKKPCYNIPLKNEDCCVITFFESFASIYVVKAVKSVTDNSYDINEPSILSKTAKSTDKILKYNPIVGDIVKVFSLSKKSFCRAKILKNNYNGSYNIFYLDFGNIEEVVSNDIYELADELQKKPGLAIKIGIDLPPLNYPRSEEIKNLFEKFIEEKKGFIIELDESAENCLEHVKLKDENGSYMSLSYLKNSLSTISTLTNRTQELNHTRTKSIPNSLINNENTTNRCQESTSNNYSNSKNFNEKISDVSIGNVIVNNIKKNVTVDFQNISLKNGDLCLVSSFKNFKNIYLCGAVKIDENKYVSHNTDIIVKTAACTDRNIKNSPVIGDIVKALSPEFTMFFRAKILNIEKDGSLLVSYIDYGNTEIVPTSNIFELSAELLYDKTKLPVCVSIEVPSNSKETLEVEELFNNLTDIVLSIEFNEKNGLQNVLLKEFVSGKSINHEILRLLSTVQVRNHDICILTHFDDLDSLYVSKGHLDENANFLNEVINNTDREMVVNPSLNDIVKVLSPSFKDFYRAKILNIEKNGDFHVFYIDFGNTEVVGLNNVFKLSDDLKIKPELAMKIGIQIPYYIKLNEDIKSMFLNLVDETSELSIEFDETSEVGLQNCILKVISSGLIINEEIIKLFPTQTPLSSVKNHDLEIKEPINSLEISKIKLLKNKEAVYLTHFANSTEIFVRKVSEDEYFMNIQEKVEKKLRKNVSNVKIGDIVKVPFESVMSRAQILDRKDQDHFCVSFIDFGNKKDVHINNIYEISDELRKIPGLCVQIGIKRFVQLDQLSEMEAYLKEFLDDVKLFIAYNENDPNGLKKASLITINNIDIFDEFFKKCDKSMKIQEELLQKSENNIDDQYILSNLFEVDVKSIIDLKSGDTVFCCNFEDFDHVYICKSFKNSTIPGNSNVIIDSSKFKSTKVKNNPKFEEIVWVKFEMKIARAKVLSKSENVYTVYLVDIGKSINVSADSIFEILDGLKLIPGLAIKVGLKATSNLKLSRTIVDYFHKLWQDEPVPLTLMYDEGNFNYLNEVNLKKLSDGHDIIDDLYNICNLSNGVPNRQIHITEDKKSPKENQWFVNGDHVEIVSGSNMDNIFIRSIKLYASYKNILDQLNGEKRENLKTINPKQYDIVAVYSSIKRGLCRAKFLGQMHDDGLKLRCALIDFGCIDAIPSKNIFELPNYASINKVPFICRKVTLAGISKSVNSTITSYLTSITGRTFILEFDKNADSWHTQVILKDLKSGKSINEEIHQLLIPKSQQRRLERKIVVNETKEIKTEEPCHPIKSGTYVNITHFENFNTIYIRDASYEALEKLSQFNLQMKMYYRQRSNICVKEMVNIGDKVCVATALNEVAYCRALVIEKCGDVYNVFNVDYGNKELVNSNDIFELPQELEKVPYFVFPVQLQNMPQLNTPNEKQVINDYIRKKMIKNCTRLILEFNECNSKGLNDVIFRTEYCQKDIADDLKNLLNAPPLNIKTGLSSTAESSPTTSCLRSPYPARRHVNASKLG